MLKKGYFKLIIAFTTLLSAGCNGENVPDCFQNAGDIIREEVNLPAFRRITVFEGVELILSSGEQQKVILETGSFLRNEVSVSVEGERLVLRNTNNCNLFRKYGITKVFVTSPDIEEVRSSTGLSVSSEGILEFKNLTLFSESFNDPETQTTDGSFNLDVDVQNLRILANGVAYFQLRGNAQRFNGIISAGSSRVEAMDLIAQEVVIDHRGSNDMLVNPQLGLSGVIRGTGDVLSYNRPDSVSVEVLYKGRLIFID